MRAFEILMKKFDKIFILNLCYRTDRYNSMIKMLSNIGYDEANQKHKDFVEFVYASPWPFNDILVRAFNMVYRKTIFTKVNEYDCMRNHCHIMEIAVARKYKHILVFEDDIRLLKEDNLITYLNHIPVDYSFIKMDGSTFDSKVMYKINDYREKGQLYIKDDQDIRLWNMGMYAISDKGIDTYLKIIFENPSVSDTPTFKHDRFSDFYNTAYPIGIQATDVSKSDIRTEPHQKSINDLNLYSKGLSDNYFEYK